MIDLSSARRSCSKIRRTAIWSWTSVAPKSTSARSVTDHGNSTGAFVGSSLKSRVGADHAAQRLRLDIAGSLARTMVAARMVEDRRFADWDHPDPDLRHSHRAPGWLRFHWRHQGRNLRHD